jgi:hypothetical protein
MPGFIDTIVDNINSELPNGVKGAFTALFRPHRYIGPIQAQVTIEENAQDDITITQHPIEYGAAITDHAFKNPPIIIINVMWSNSGIGAVLNTAQAAIAAFEGSAGAGFNYIRDVYEKLIKLQASRTLIDIGTGKRNYKNMLIRSVIQRTAAETENSLAITLICQQVILVQTTASTLPDASVMQYPKKTAATQNGGTAAPTSAVPASGGAYSIGG